MSLPATPSPRPGLPPKPIAPLVTNEPSLPLRVFLYLAISGTPFSTTVMYVVVALLVIPSFYGLLFDRKKRLLPSKAV